MDHIMPLSTVTACEYSLLSTYLKINLSAGSIRQLPVGNDGEGRWYWGVGGGIQEGVEVWY